MTDAAFDPHTARSRRVRSSNASWTMSGQIVRHAACPVLIVPRVDHISVPPAA